jgi:hypothetical protein
MVSLNGLQSTNHVEDTEAAAGCSNGKTDSLKNPGDDDPASSRTDGSENSETLVTDSVTDEPTLTNS